MLLILERETECDSKLLSHSSAMLNKLELLKILRVNLGLPCRPDSIICRCRSLHFGNDQDRIDFTLFVAERGVGVRVLPEASMNRHWNRMRLRPTGSAVPASTDLLSI